MFHVFEGRQVVVADGGRLETNRDVFQWENMQKVVQLSKVQIWIPKNMEKAQKTHKTLQSVERIKNQQHFVTISL